MMGPLLFSLRFALAAGALLGLLGVAPASAASFTVYWDRSAFGGFDPGFGLSESTALAANAAGIPIVAVPNAEFPPLVPQPTSLVVNHNVTESSFIPGKRGNPSTIDSQWSATNNTGFNDQSLYLVYMRPIPNEFVLEEKDTGLVLSNGGTGVDWVILQTPSNDLDPNSIPVYYPAVSLGTLGSGDTKQFALHYSLFDLQVTQGTNLDEVELPQWTLAFTTATPIPEPSSGLLMFVGLLAIARARRKHA